MPEYRFTVTEHNRDKPWLVVGSEHRTIELAETINFFDWAHEHWPEPRWSVDLDPWQMSPERPGR